MRVFPTHIVAASGITINDKGQVLLVKHHRAGWVFPGGQVENGENVIDAVIRETKEESGIDVEIQQLFCISSNTCEYPGYNGFKNVPTKVMMDFICTPLGGKICTSDENSETGWFSKEDALSMIKAPAILKRYKAFMEFDGKVKYLEYVTKPDFEIKEDRKI